jgi:DNA/RNA-binding domain of Phe-tRNA-synthetase-like protein
MLIHSIDAIKLREIMVGSAAFEFLRGDFENEFVVGSEREKRGRETPWRNVRRCAGVSKHTTPASFKSEIFIIYHLAKVDCFCVALIYTFLRLLSTPLYNYFLCYP